jgi:hypothetical protein
MQLKMAPSTQRVEYAPSPVIARRWNPQDLILSSDPKIEINAATSLAAIALVYI